MRFSLRSQSIALSLTCAVLALATVAMEYAGMARVDGRSSQSVMLRFDEPQTITSIRFVAVHQGYGPDLVASELANPNENSLISPDMIGTINEVMKSNSVTLDQQWSYTQMGLTERRPNYSQTYDWLVLDVNYTDNISKQHIVELPNYGQPTSVNLSWLR